MIGHRATVFETNTARWVDSNSGQLDVPAGYQATWDQRHILGVAKLASQVSSSTTDLKALVLSCGATSADDNFIEVHILGGFTIRSASRVVVRGASLSKLSKAALDDCAAKLNLQVLEVV